MRRKFSFISIINFKTLRFWEHISHMHRGQHHFFGATQFYLTLTIFLFTRTFKFFIFKHHVATPRETKIAKLPRQAKYRHFGAKKKPRRVRDMCTGLCMKIKRCIKVGVILNSIPLLKLRTSFSVRKLRFFIYIMIDKIPLVKIKHFFEC